LHIYAIVFWLIVCVCIFILHCLGEEYHNLKKTPAPKKPKFADAVSKKLLESPAKVVNPVKQNTLAKPKGKAKAKAKAKAQAKARTSR
jgi:hypothetical protein